MIQSIVLLLMLWAAAVAGPRDRVYRSPGGRLTAHVIGIGNRGFEDQESRIELRTVSGRAVRSHSFRSADGQHGYGVGHAQWSRIGRWFVVNCSSSGGHMPWNSPIWVFDRRTRRFYDLQRWIGPVTSDFRLVGADGVATTRMNTATGIQDDHVLVHLSRIIGRVRRYRREHCR